MALDDRLAGLDDATRDADHAFAGAHRAYDAYERRLETFRDDLLAAVRRWLPDAKLHDYRGSNEDDWRAVNLDLPTGVFKSRQTLHFLAGLLALEHDLEQYKSEHTVGSRDVIDVFPLYDRTELTIRPFAEHALPVLEAFLNRGLRNGRQAELPVAPFGALTDACDRYCASLAAVVPAAERAIRGYAPVKDAELEGEMLRLRIDAPVPPGLADRWQDCIRPHKNLEFRMWSSTEPEVVLHKPYWLSLAQARSCGLQLYPRHPASSALFTAYCDSLKHRESDAAKPQQAQAIDLGSFGPDDFGGSDF